RAELDTVAERSCCVVDQELEPGLRSIVAPAHDPDGSVVAALYVSTHAARYDRRHLRGGRVPAVFATAWSLSTGRATAHRRPPPPHSQQNPMRDVVICQPLRTPVGRFGGVFRDLDAGALATDLLTALVERTGLSGPDVDDVILGQGSPGGEGPAIGRIAALDSPLGIDVPGMQLDRRCGSGLQAVITSALQVASGGVDTVVAGGVESMSQVEFYATPTPRWGIKGDGVSLVDRLGRARTTVGGRSHVIDGGMIETAE